MRLFFSDVYNLVVAKVWQSNFHTEKDPRETTLKFIEEKAYELEPLMFTIRGKSMSVSWEAKDIMRGWFSEHKKHKIRHHRISQIEKN